MSNHQLYSNEAIKSGASGNLQSWDRVSRIHDPRYWMSLGPFYAPPHDFWESLDLQPDEKPKTNKGNGADHGANTDANHGAGDSAKPDDEAFHDTLNDLKDKQIWVFWRVVALPGRDKPTKVPYSPVTGGEARSDAPRTWGDWYVANRYAKQHNNQIGIMFGTIGELHLAGIDLDSCRNAKTGKLKSWAEEVIERFASYAEVSPSGTGVKVFCYIRNSDKPALDALFGGADKHGRQFKKGGGEHPQAIEVYRSNRYFAVTGLQYESYAKLRVVPVADFEWLIITAGPRLKGQQSKASSSSSPYQGSTNQGNDNSRSGKAFREALRMKDAGMSYEQVRDALLNHADPDIHAWAHEKGATNNERELHRAYDNAKGFLPKGCKFEHFVAHMEEHTYFYLPTMTPWPPASVNSRLPLVPILKEDGTPVLDSKGKPKKMKPNIHLDKTRPIEQLLWSPDDPMIVEDRYLKEGGWVPHEGGRSLNTYQPPTIKHGDAAQAGPFVDLWFKMYPDDADHILDYMAFKVQNPGKKINHGIVLFGDGGIGKDSGLEPLSRAVGEWNFRNVKPNELFEQYNPFVRGVIMRLNEAHDTGEVSRYQLYERMKDYLAAPPAVIPVKDKYIRRVDVMNVMGVFITTNHLTDGIYLPADDRRHYVAASKIKPTDFEPGYFDRLWDWYENGGFEHIAAYLAQRDVSKFNPKAPPKKTEAFWKIVDANRAPEEGELQDVIDLLGNPKALTIADLISKTVFNNSLAEWLKDRKNRRLVLHRLEKCDYEPFRNPDAVDGLWKIGHDRQVVYVQKELTVRERMEAARELAKKGKPKKEWSKGKRQRSWSKAKPRENWKKTTPNRPNFAGGSSSSGDVDYDAPPRERRH